MTLKGDFPDPEEVAALAMMALAAVALAGGLVIDAFWRLPRLRGHRRVHSHEGKSAYAIYFFTAAASSLCTSTRAGVLCPFIAVSRGGTGGSRGHVPTPTQ
jgi:hypothetical protein